MWNSCAVIGLALLAQASPAPASGPPATPLPGPRVCRQANHAELEKLKLRFPEQYTLASFATTVRDAPSSEGKVLERLPLGTTLEAVGLVQGTEARNDCEASPYDGCVDATDAWLEVKLPEKPGKEPRQGFLSFINVRAPAALACDTLPWTTVFQLQPPESPVEPAPGKSFFDSVGLGNFLALHVVDGQVELSRRQLEFFVRHQPTGRIRYGAVRPESGFPLLDPLMTDVELQPALPVFVVEKGRLSSAKVDRLQAVHPVLFPDRHAVDDVNFGSGWPLYAWSMRFRLPKALASAGFLILTTPQGAQALKEGQPKVTRKSEKDSDSKRALVQVDFDGDGTPDLVRVDTTYEDSNEEDEFALEDTQQVRLRIGGKWYFVEGRGR